MNEKLRIGDIVRVTQIFFDGLEEQHPGYFNYLVNKAAGFIGQTGEIVAITDDDPPCFVQFADGHMYYLYFDELELVKDYKEENQAIL